VRRDAAEIEPIPVLYGYPVIATMQDAKASQRVSPLEASEVSDSGACRLLPCRADSPPGPVSFTSNLLRYLPDQAYTASHSSVYAHMNYLLAI